LEDGQVGFGSTEFIVMRGKARSLSAFGACLARSEHFRKFAILNMTGTSGRKRIEAPILKTFPLSIPPIALLSIFEDICEPIFQKMTANEKENQELIQLRDWLLPMLMNGQVTVN
jgi:type I restriction enzyme S subunit